MKTVSNFRMGIWMAVLVALFVMPRQASAQVNVSISFQTFYDELSPYGYWMNTPDYGYVWQPNVASNFQPYATNGYWVMTEYGNTWVSDYDWGWAPFHYGRWYYDNYYGWLWMPDTEWGPAWVSWRSGSGYYGWAPMGPRVYQVPVNYWVFVPNRYITHRRFYDHCLPRTRVVNVYQQTTIVNNYYTYNNHRYVSGPSVREVERHTGSRVRMHQVRDEARPGRASVNDGAVRVYRPNISERAEATPRRMNTGLRRGEMAERSNENANPGRGGREGFSNTGRDNQIQNQERNTPGVRSRSIESERPARMEQNRIEGGRIETTRPGRTPEFPARRDNATNDFRTNESVQPQPNREFRNETRQPSIDNNARRSEWGSRNAESESRGVQPREQRQMPAEPVQPQRREEPRREAEPRWERQPQQSAPTQPVQRQERIETPQQRRSEPSPSAPQQQSMPSRSGRQSSPEAPDSRPSRGPR